MFNLQTVKEIQALESSPSLTITLPTYRTAPENHKDPIRLKNLVTEATQRLEQEHGKRETSELVSKLHELTDEIDHQHNLDGLIVLVSAEYAQVFKVPYRLPERVAIDNNFLTRDIVFAMNRSPLYWTLVLSEKPTRLYIGRKENLSEDRHFNFPMEYNGPGTGVAVKSGVGADPSREKDRALEAFMRDVDQELSEVLKRADYPVLLVGLAQNLSTFKAVTKNERAFIGEVEGGHDSLSAHDLGQLVWPEAKAGLRTQRENIFADIEQAVSQSKFTTDYNESWQAAKDGRVEVMVVEENKHQPAEVSEDGRQLTLLETGKEEGEHAYADIIDEMIEEVMQNGGRVVFVDDGELADYQGLIMLTRY